MELQTDLESPLGGDDMKIPTPMELQTTLACPQVKDDITIPTPMELQTDLECPQVEDDIKIPTPHGTSNWLGVCTRLRWYENFHPHGTSNWLGVCTRLRWYENSHPHGTSNWLGVSARLRWYENSHPHGTFKAPHAVCMAHFDGASPKSWETARDHQTNTDRGKTKGMEDVSRGRGPGHRGGGHGCAGEVKVKESMFVLVNPGSHNHRTNA